MKLSGSKLFEAENIFAFTIWFGAFEKIFDLHANFAIYLCDMFCVRHFYFYFNFGCGVLRTPSATFRKMLWKYVWPLLTNAKLSSVVYFIMFLWYRDFGSAKRKHIFMLCLCYKWFRDPCVRIVEKMLTRSYNVKHRKIVLPRKKNLLNCVGCKNVILFFQY